MSNVAEAVKVFVKGAIEQAQTTESLGGTTVTEAEMVAIIERGLGMGYDKGDLTRCLAWFDDYTKSTEFYVIGDHSKADLRIEPQQVTQLFRPSIADVRADAIKDRVVRRQMQTAGQAAAVALVRAEMRSSPRDQAYAMAVCFTRVVDAADALLAAAERLPANDPDRALMLGYAREMAKLATAYATKTSESITQHDPDGKVGQSFRSTDSNLGAGFDRAFGILEDVNQRLPTVR